MSIKKGSKTIASSNQITNWGSINGNISDQEDLKNLLQIKADVNSPTFYGTPTVPTAEDGTNNLQIANTKFVQNAISKFDALPDQTNNSGKVLSTDGSNPIWVNQSSSNDGKSITLNDNGEIQASGIVNSNNPSEVVTMWIGTKDEYNALPSHSDTCIYNITDDATYESFVSSTNDAIKEGSLTLVTNDTALIIDEKNPSENSSFGIKFTDTKNNVSEINHYSTVNSSGLKINDIDISNNQESKYVDMSSYNNVYVPSVNDFNPSNNVASTKWSTDFLNRQRTNCITEVPQDIKLELVDEVLILKAGSKVYVPNGFEADGTTPKFDKVVIESDVTKSLSTDMVVSFITYVPASNSLFVWGESVCSSGTTQPTSQYFFWYDTTNNKVKNSNNSGDSISISSFPIAKTNNTRSSIDQVFNGFGYIGSTVFVLPGVKGLISNGRNEDGSLRNKISKTENVLTYTTTSNYSRYFSLLSNGNNIFTRIDYMTDYALNTNAWKYDRLSNIWSYNNKINTSWINFSHATIQESAPYKITSFEPTSSFGILDYNNLTPQLLQSRGIQSVIETYKNGTSWYRIWSDGWCEQGGYVNVAANSVANGTVVKFLKSFIDANYTITMLSCHNDTSTNNLSVPYGNSYYGCYQLNSKTKESIKLCGVGTWYACGYIS